MTPFVKWRALRPKLSGSLRGFEHTSQSQKVGKFLVLRLEWETAGLTDQAITCRF